MWARRLASANDTVIPAGESTTVAVAGRDGVPTDATAAVVSVTSRAADTAGALFVYPSGGTAPSDPAVYARAGERVTGTAIVPLGSNGNVDVSNVGGSDRAVDVDIVGWYAAPSASGPGANGIGYVAKRHPKPVLDTATDRGLGSLGPDATGTFGVGAAVPNGARAVVMQVTVKQANPATRLTLWRADKARPGTVNLSVPGGRTVTTMVIVPVRATQPRVSIHNHAGSVSIRATVVGYYLDPSLG
jgi:hypothetical protein